MHGTTLKRKDDDGNGEEEMEDEERAILGVVKYTAEEAMR